MRDDELQKELRPGGAVEIRRPRRKSFPSHPVEKISTIERAIEDHCHVAFARERQQAILRRTVREIVSVARVRRASALSRGAISIVVRKLPLDQSFELWTRCIILT